ncbi:hypothetical protein [Leekyejoonella antrihumi]|uniref:DUF2530 domain-containing protein n=1 Tax=Leekyejoonella antrihumi TaxID=1660198 RepID=A0A563E093_9MICO|nr:hypothetical protein [Leekyejoonella antrihumi]TWP35960.1 hypothetical protein FGL98_12060 [Leekyejoonella antrihumi]
MRENRLEAVWLVVTIVYGCIVGLTTGHGWSDTFTIVGAIIVGIGWVLIGMRRHSMRRHYEERVR